MTETWHDEIVAVLSNAVSGNGMTNTPGHYNVRLPSPISLQVMEVGVRNITFPTTWNPTPLKDRHHQVPRWAVTVGYDGSRGPFPNKAHANPGPLAQWVDDDHHNTMLFTLANMPTKTNKDVITQIIRQMNETLPNKDFGLMWVVAPINVNSPRRLILRNRSRVTTTTLWANETLCTLLNFGRDPNDAPPVRYLVTQGLKRSQLLSDISSSQQRLTTPFKRISNKNTTTIKNAIDLDGSALPPPDVRTQFERFLVYCDSIKDRIVGCIRTGFLNVTPNPGMTIQYNATSFSTETMIPLYYPTIESTTQSLTFRVRDDDGDPIDFTWGATSLELHFRRRRL